MTNTPELQSKAEACELLLQAMAAPLSAASPDMDREACLAVCHGIESGNVTFHLRAGFKADVGLKAVCCVERGGESVELFTVESPVSGGFRHVEVPPSVN
jgi:hypothetical protein